MKVNLSYVLIYIFLWFGGAMTRDNESLKNLSPLQYRVTQECGTEPAFNNEYWNNKKAGIYVDIVSGKPLFSSIDKFESGTGWPSFTSPLVKENIAEKKDKSLGMERIEVKSITGSHLGHVFNDGPAPTGQRYCINSAALRFIPAENLDKEGYGMYSFLFTKGTQEHANSSLQIATFAAGCFWGVEYDFKKVAGVKKTEVGYIGGTTKNPTYEDVCTHTTGHAEAVNVYFDPKVVSYDKLVDAFWNMHDPTTLNRQGPDVGDQYRSAIFYHSPEQKEIAERAVAKLTKDKRFAKKIVTEISEAPTFYKAEEYHQDYFTKHPDRAFCHIR